MDPALIVQVPEERTKTLGGLGSFSELGRTERPEVGGPHPWKAQPEQIAQEQRKRFPLTSAFPLFSKQAADGPADGEWFCFKRDGQSSLRGELFRFRPFTVLSWSLRQFRLRNRFARLRTLATRHPNW